MTIHPGTVLERHGLEGASTTAEWDSFVGVHPEGTPFHLSGWLRCLCDTYGFEASLFVLRDDMGEIAALLPLVRVQSLVRRSRYVSLPFSDYGGVLARDQEAGRYLIDALGTIFTRQKTRLELRCAVSERPKWRQHTLYVRHSLDLTTGIGEVSKRLERRTIQYSIRKAEKAGIEIEETTSAEGTNEFYRLHRLTRAKHGVPSPPLGFFQTLVHGLAPGATPSILLARHGDSAIAAGFFIEFKRTLYFKYSASDPEKLSSMTPNHLLTWHAIRSASERGLERVDFGRSAPTDEGLCRYKRMWGAVETALPYSYFPGGVGAAPVGEAGIAYSLATSLWRRLPNRVQDRIGPRVYRYLG